MEKTPYQTYLSCVSMVNKAKGLSQEPYMKVCFSVCLAKVIFANLFLPTYFTIQLIFAIIHGSQCTIAISFYLYLQYFQQKFSVSAK